METSEKFSEKLLQEEAQRLYKKLQHVNWSKEDCTIYAPLTYEINQRKKEQDTIILAHSYQTPDIMYGVADFIGDSYGLSKIAAEHPAKQIIFCGVHFMAETAKLLSPEKTVLVPKKAGCSLDESITAEDVRELKRKHPGAPVVCYVNTSAAVKAEIDVCCTSANALEVIESFEEDTIIFIPDQHMTANIQKQTSKTLIPWHGSCIVHDEFTEEHIESIRKEYPDVKIAAHPECSSSIIDKVDMVGGTRGIIDYIAKTDAENFMIVTECGITDRIKTEYQGKNIVGTCSLCPYMKKILIKDILQVLIEPTQDQIIDIPKETAYNAQKSLEKMFELTKKATGIVRNNELPTTIQK